MEERDVDRIVRRNEWRLDALDAWRDRVDRTLAGLQERLDGLVTAQEIAKAVTEALKQEQRDEDEDKVTIGNLKVARWQVWLGVAGLVAAVAAPYVQAGIR